MLPGFDSRTRRPMWVEFVVSSRLALRVFFGFSGFPPSKKNNMSKFQFDHDRSNISNTRDSVSSGYPNTEKRVENTTRSGVFLTKFEVFG